MFKTHDFFHVLEFSVGFFFARCLSEVDPAQISFQHNGLENPSANTTGSTSTAVLSKVPKETATVLVSRKFMQSLVTF